VKCIINADDLGMGQKENDAIFDLLEQGAITSSTLLATGSALDDAIERIHSYPKCSFGIHLCLTEFAPISKSSHLAPLLDNDGNFKSNIREVVLDSTLRGAIFTEWCLQVEKLISKRVLISHIDSHHHVHTIFLLFPIIKKLQRKYQIKRIRRSRNMYSSSCAISSTLLMKKALWNTALRYFPKTKTTSGFTTFSNFLEIASAQVLPHKMIELMVHPGNELFKSETSVLWTDWQSTILSDIELISFNEL